MADGSVVIDIGVSTQNAEKKIREIRDKIKSLASAEVSLKVDTGDAKSKLKSIDGSLNNITKMSKTAIAINFSTSSAASKIDGLINSVNRLNSSLSNQLNVNINTNTARNQLKGLEESSRNFSNSVTKVRTVNINTDVAKSKLETVSSNVSEVNKKATKKAKVDIDTSTANNNVKRLNNETNRFFNMFRGNGSVVKAVTGSLNNIQSSFKSMTSSVTSGISKISSGLTNLKSKVELFTGALGVISLAKKAVETASDLQEVQNVVDVIFEDMSQTINDWSKTTKNSFGIAELEAKRYVSRLGALYKDYGITGKSLTNISTTMTEVVADYASFFNTSFEEAYTKFESAISGSSIRALRDFGINLTEANLDAYALEKGLSTVYSKMNDVDKAALRTAYILEKSGDEAGDFARTFDSWANTLRTLKQTVGEILTTVGQALIQIFKPVVDYISILLNNLAAGAERFKNYIYYLFGISDTFKEVSDTEDYASQQADKLGNVSNDLTSSLTGVGDEAESSAKKMKQLLSPIDELNILADNTSDSLNNLGLSTTANSANALNNALNVDYKGIQFKKPEKTIKDIQDTINKALSKIDLTKGLKILADKINLFFKVNNSSNLASNIADWINKGVSSVNTFLEAVNFENIGKYIANSIINFVSKVDTKEVGKMIANLFNSLVDLLYGFLNSNDFTVMGEKIADGINGIAENVNASKFGKTINLALKRGAELALGLFKKIKWAEIGKTVSSGINNAVGDKSTFVTIGKAFSELLNGAIDLLVNLIENTDWTAVGNAVAVALSNVDWGRVLEGVGRLILDSIGAIFSTLTGMHEVDGIVGGIGSIATAILTINGASKAVGVVKGIVDALTTTGFVSLITNPVFLGGLIGIGGLTMFGESVAGLYSWHTTKNNTRSPIEIMTEEQENLRTEVSKSKTEVDNLASSVKNYSDELDKNYDEVYDLVDELKLYVDENGNVKDGYENNVNYIKNQLKDAYGIELDIIDDKIQGYKDLESQINKVIKKKDALAIQGAFGDDFANAQKNQKQYTDNLIKSEKEYKSQMDKLQSIADFINENASSKFLEQFGKSKITADDLKGKLRSIDFTKFGWGLSNTQIKEVNQKFADLFGTPAFKNPSEWKAFGGLRQYTIEQSDLATELEFTKIQAEDNVKKNRKLIDNYDNLSKVLENSKSSTEDIDKAIKVLTDDMDTASNATIDDLKYQAEELKKQYDDLVKKYKKGDKQVTKSMVDEAEKRYKYAKQEIEKRAILEDPNANDKLKSLIKSSTYNWTETFQTELYNYFKGEHQVASADEYVEFYMSVFGAEHLNEALTNLVNAGKIDPKDAISAVLKNSPDTSPDDINKMVDKFFSKDKYKDGVEDSLVEAFIDGSDDAIKQFINSNPTMSDAEFNEFINAVIPDGTSDSLRKELTEEYKSALNQSRVDAINEYIKSNPNISESDLKEYVKKTFPDIQDKDLNDIVEKITTYMRNTSKNAISKYISQNPEWSEEDLKGYLKQIFPDITEDELNKKVDEYKKALYDTKDKAVKQHIKENPEMSDADFKEWLKGYFPELSEKEINDKVESYAEDMEKCKKDALKKYIEETPEATYTDKYKMAKKIFPDMSDEMLEILIDSITGAINNANSLLNQGKNVVGSEPWLDSLQQPFLAPLTQKSTTKNVMSNAYNLEEQFKKTGGFITAGLSKGILDSSKSVLDTVKNLGLLLIDTANSSTGVASPSKKTMETGKYIVEGLSLGISNNLSIVTKSAQKLGDTVISAINDKKSYLKGLLNIFGSTLAKSLADGISAYKDKIGGIGKSLVKEAVKGLCTISSIDKINLAASGILIVTLFKNGVSKSAENIGKTGSNIVKDIVNGISSSVTSYSETLKSKAKSLIGYFKSGVTNGINSVKNETSKLSNTVVNSVGKNQSDNNTKMYRYGSLLITNFKNGISNSKAQVEQVATSIRKNLVNTFSTCLTDILDIVDLFYSKFSDKWSKIGQSVKGVMSMMGANGGNFNITSISYPYGNNSLPKLASGAVIKPNNEFMAILGDQKRGVNIETPLETMVSAFKSALSDSNTNGDIYVPLYIGNEYLDTFIVKANSKRTMRNNGRG